MRIRAWAKRVAIVWGIELALLAACDAVVSSSIYRRWHSEIADCSNDRNPTPEQELQAAHRELEFQARHVGVPAGQFFLTAPPYGSQFIFQVTGDHERPRQIRITVFDCLDAESIFRNLHPRY